MSRLIILEGPDECGKTTLGLHLSRFFNATYIHATASKSLFSALPDYHKSLLEIAVANLELDRGVVMDRFWPSEICYGPLFRPQSKYSEFAPYLMEKIKEQNYLYIFCLANSAWSRYEKGHVDPAHSLTKEQYMEVWHNYMVLYDQMRNFGDNVLFYNLDTDASSPLTLATFLDHVKQKTET